MTSTCLHVAHHMSIPFSIAGGLETGGGVFYCRQAAGTAIYGSPSKRCALLGKRRMVNIDRPAKRSNLSGCYPKRHAFHVDDSAFYPYEKVRGKPRHP